MPLSMIEVWRASAMECVGTNITTKLCTECGQDKPLESFRRQSKNKDGLKYMCRDCDNLYNQLRYQHLKDRIKKQALSYYYKNKSKQSTRNPNPNDTNN